MRTVQAVHASNPVVINSKSDTRRLYCQKHRWKNMLLYTKGIVQ